MTDEDTDPGDDRTGDPDRGDPGTDDADVDPFQIESRLTSHAIYVSEFSGSESEGYDLIYESMAADQGAIPGRELGRVINVFRDLFGEDWEGTRIDATVCDLEGTPVATWHCEAAWLAGLATGELSEVAFSDRVTDTLEPIED